MNSQVVWRPGPNDPKDSIVVMKNDKVILEPLDLNGYARGFNSNSGASGLVPLFVFEGNAVAFDIGSSLMLADWERELAKFPSRIVLDPSSWIKSIKNFLISDMDDQFILFNVTVVQKLHLEFEFDNQSKSLSILEILQKLLKDAKYASDKATNSNATKPGRIVFPIPYLFNYYQKLLLRQAALDAGFVHVDFVFQNVAAAVHYSQQSSDMGLMLVISIGSYFTDISFLVKSGDRIETLGMIGIQIGGSDVTKLLFARVKEEMKLSLDGVQDKAQERQLYNECELAKVNLSTMKTVRIPIKPGQDYVLSRDIMAEIQAPVQRKVATAIERCFVQANKQYGDVETVLLTGDAIPILDPLLSVFSSTSRIVQSSVVMGAARFAHRTLQRACGSRYFHYGIGVGDDGVIPVLSATDTSPKQVLLNPLPGHSVVYVDLYEVSYLLARKNVRLARIQVDWFPFFEQTLIKVLFEITDAILKVTVYAGERVIATTFINNVDQVAFEKGVDGRHTGLRVVGEVDGPQLLCAPYRDDSLPTSSFFNALLDIHRLAEVFEKRVSRELAEEIVKRFSYYFDLINLWTSVANSWQLQGGDVSISISDNRNRISAVMQKFEQILMNEQLDFISLREIKSGFDAEIVYLDAVVRHTEDIRKERKLMIDFCHMCVRLCDKLAGMDTMKLSKVPISSVIFSLVKRMDNSPLELPNLITSMLLPQAHLYLKNMRSLVKSHAYISLDNQIRGLIPAERASYTALINISNQINNFINENHIRVLQIPLVLTDGQIKPQDNKDCFIYEEHLLKVLIQLDNVSIHDQAILRTTRKSLVNYCQAHLNQIDSLKSLHKAHK